MPIITGATNGASEAAVQSDIAGEWGTAAGNAYRTYYDAHPNLSPTQAGDQFATILLAEGVDKGIATAVSGVATAQGQVITGTAKGAEQAVSDLSPAALFNKLSSLLTSRGTWIRIAEGVLGIALILVAVAELGKGTAVGKLAKKVPGI